MKKALSLSLLFVLTVSSALPAFAQRSKIDLARKPAPKSKPASTESTKFRGVKASTSGRGVLIEWQMEMEKANIGFNIYRIDKGGLVLVNSEIVFGSAAMVGRQPLYGETYQYFDDSGSMNAPYFIETLDLDGNRLLSPSFTPTYSHEILARGPKEAPEPEALRSSNLKIPRELGKEVEIGESVADINTHLWVIGQPGVKIGVRKEGIYRVPRSQLETAGFNVSAPSNLWQLYVEGVEQAIIVGPGDSYIEFYGKGVDTIESDTQAYFLIVGNTAGKRIQNQVARPSNSPVVLRSYNQTFVLKERINYLNTVLNGDAENYWGRGIGSGAGTNVNFDLTGVDFTSPESTMALNIQGFSGGIHTIRITLNGQQLNSFNGIAQFPFSNEQPVPTSLLRDASLGQGTNVLNLASIGPSGDFNLFDSVSINFNRTHLASQQKEIKAYSVNSKITKIRGFASPNIRVFDTTIESSPALMTNLTVQQQGPTSFGIDLPGARGRLFYAAEDSAIQVPASVVWNNPVMLGNEGHNANLVIIAYGNFLTEANAWANYRRSPAGGGFSVEVVDVDDIFNEYNYGVLSSNSIEAFLNYAYNNWDTPPQYVLLLGDASHNSRNYNNTGFFNYVPTRIINTLFTETGSDESLADFDDDGLSEIAIGRVAARDGNTITNVLAKVSNWEANLLTAPLNRGALFAYDEPAGYNFQAMSERIRDEITWPVGVTPTMVFRLQPNAQTDLLAAMNAGKYLVNYSGHGTITAWQNNGFFWNESVSTLTNDGNESLFTMLTCLNGYFLGVGNFSLAETLVEEPTGGAIAVWASAGLTTPDIQEVMGRRFYNKIGEGTIPRLGDLIKDAKTTIPGGTDVRLSYVLIGDPVLKVR